MVGDVVNRLIRIAGLIALGALTFWAFSEPDAPVNPTGVRVGPADAYNPVTAGETLPDGFRQLLPRDAIAPVYDPAFVPAGESGWPGLVDVIGVAGGNEAKAYPVSFLNRREMVLDEIGGDPILVTW